MGCQWRQIAAIECDGLRDWRLALGEWTEVLCRVSLYIDWVPGKVIAFAAISTEILLNFLCLSSFHLLLQGGLPAIRSEH